MYRIKSALSFKTNMHWICSWIISSICHRRTSGTWIYYAAESHKRSWGQWKCQNVELFQRTLHVWSQLWVMHESTVSSSVWSYSKKNKRERVQEKVGWQAAAPPASFPAHSQDGHIVPPNKSNGWHRDKQASVVFRFTESARRCSFIPRSPRAAASREP